MSLISKFSVKGQRVNILAFTDHSVPVTTTGFCNRKNSGKLYVTMWVWLCSNKTLFIKSGCKPWLTPEPQFVTHYRSSPPPSSWLCSVKILLIVCEIICAKVCLTQQTFTLRTEPLFLPTPIMSPATGH